MKGGVKGAPPSVYTTSKVEMSVALWDVLVIFGLSSKTYSDNYHQNSRASRTPRPLK